MQRVQRVKNPPKCSQRSRPSAGLRGRKRAFGYLTRALPLTEGVMWFWQLSTMLSWPKKGIPGGFHARRWRGIEHGPLSCPGNRPTPYDQGRDAMEKMPFKRHFLRGEIESILNGLGPTLGLGLLRI